MRVPRLTVVALWFSLALCAKAQTLTFDVVSIHETKDMESMGWRPMSYTATGMLAENAPLRDIVAAAFYKRGDGSFPSGRLVGPGWMDDARFDVRAKLDPADAEAFAKMSSDAKDQMLLALLADRFRMKYHTERREFTEYALVVAKGGPKLTPTKPPASADEKPATCHFLNVRGHTPIYQSAEACSTGEIAESMSNWVNARVVDQTGMRGQFDYTIGWDDSTMGGRSTGIPVHPGMEGLSLFDAVQQQLGLKLVPSRVVLDVYVIDHIEKPSEN